MDKHTNFQTTTPISLDKQAQISDDRITPIMDPKALDHLDPKQKEKYDRIMGHATTSDESASEPTSQPDQLSETPGISHDFSGAPTDPFPNTPDMTQSTDFANAPVGATAGGVDLSGPQFYTPGQESTSDTVDPFQEPASTPFEASLSSSSQENLAPPNSSFFSNPSVDAASTPQPQENLSSPFQSPVEEAPTEPLSSFPASTPVTPYTPSEVPGLAPASSFAAPLPSPASVNQELPHEASPLLRVLYIVGAVVFFAIYTIFWVKVFNLPFLF